MLNEYEAMELVIEKYDELWGVKTVDQWVKHHSVATRLSYSDAEIFKYTICQVYRLSNNLTDDIFNEDSIGTILPAHRTHFIINRKTGDMEIIEDW